MAHRLFTVAVVDDDEGILRSLEHLLESADYGVRLFKSAAALLHSGFLVEIDCLISNIEGDSHLSQKRSPKPTQRLPRNRFWSGCTTSTVRYISFDKNRLAGERACSRRISASDAFTAANPCSIISRS